MILGTVSVDSGYKTEELKSMWRLADAVLRNGNEYYVCYKIINDVVPQLGTSFYGYKYPTQEINKTNGQIQKYRKNKKKWIVKPILN